jgi:uroporphyrinogen-III synthase
VRRERRPESALGGARILVTRPEAQSGPLCEAIVAAGGEPLAFPVIAIVDPTDPAQAREAVAGVERHAVAVFVSANAVRAAFALAAQLDPPPRWPVLVAVGEATRAALLAHGQGRVLAPSGRYDSEAVLDLEVLQPGVIRGESVIVFKGEGGRELLLDELRRRGARVTAALVYRRALPAADPSALRTALAAAALDAVVVTSAEAAANLFELVGPECVEALRGLSFVVVSERVGARVRELGVRAAPIIAARASDAAIVDSLRGLSPPPPRLARTSARSSG